MAVINPYNFVPLGSGPDRSKEYTNRHRLKADNYSGKLFCTLETLGPVMTLDQRGTPETIPHVNGAGNRTGKEIKSFRFLRNTEGKPIVQGTSIKGMIRAVYEAMTDSCLTFTAEAGSDYRYTMPSNYGHTQCKHLNKLCPACRLFGTINGNDIHCQGQVSFTDAVLGVGELTQMQRVLKTLSNPKPRHAATYSDGHNNIAGRKFYYHHAATTHFWKELPEANPKQDRVVSEYAPKGFKFTLWVYFENLGPEELGCLLLALELSSGLAHKIGLGKAIGLGSCSISIDRSGSNVSLPHERYGGNAAKNPVDWYSLKAVGTSLPPELVEILRTNKPSGDIGYPPHNDEYPSQRINALGVFGGSATAPGKPAQSASAPSGRRPNLPGNNMVWLKEIDGDDLVFISPSNYDGKEKHTKMRKHLQKGNNSHLVLGNWFALIGAKGFKAIVKE